MGAIDTREIERATRAAEGLRAECGPGPEPPPSSGPLATAAACAPSGDNEIAAGLLATLGRHLSRSDLRFAEPPELLAGGSDNEIYAFRLEPCTLPPWPEPELLAGPLVLRIFDRSAMPRRASWEAALHGALHEQGLPVPRVLLADDGGTDLHAPALILERLPGRGLIESLAPVRRITDPRSALAVVPQIARLLYQTLPLALARMDRKLARIDTDRVITCLEQAGFPKESLCFERHLLALEERTLPDALRDFRPLVSWLRSHRPPECNRPGLAHGDLPGNLLLHADRTGGVIDWSPAFVAICDPAYQIATTLVMLSFKLPLSQPLAWLAEVLQRATIYRYLREVQQTLRLDATALDYYQAFRCTTLLLSAAEARLARAGVLRPDLARITPWDQPLVLLDLIEQVRRHTGIRVRMPARQLASEDVLSATFTHSALSSPT